MCTDEYIWVNVPGGVAGYTPEDVAEFEADLKTFSEPVDYWDYWNFYFNTEPYNNADGFSTLWHFDKAWKRLEELRKHSNMPEIF